MYTLIIHYPKWDATHVGLDKAQVLKDLEGYMDDAEETGLFISWTIGREGE